MNGRKKRPAIVQQRQLATCRLLDDLLQRDALARYEVVVFGAERGGAYNRILLSKVLGGDDPDAIITKPPAWYAARGVQLHDGVSVRRLDAGAKLIETEDGAQHRYDIAVLATGSQPTIFPPARRA